MEKNEIVYYVRIYPTVNTYDLCELRVRTLYEDSFVGVDQEEKRAYLISYDQIGETVFTSRAKALEVIGIAEKNKKPVASETYYEEY